jgi:hypothetical protein
VDEKQFQVAAQVIDGIGGDLGSALRLGQDKCAMQRRLFVQGGALGRPVTTGT